MKKRNSGFTLVEVVVVLAVVAILAAILTPNIVKNIKDSKIARANNETQVIAAGLASFYKDVGRWPTSDGAASALPDELDLIYGSGLAPASAGATSDGWVSGGGSLSEDTFVHHLVENNPGGAANDYPSTGELKWNGPYIIEVKVDPFGCHYSCNILYTYDTTTNFVGILSAGPDRIAATLTAQPSTGVTIVGDDILTRLQ